MSVRGQIIRMIDVSYVLDLDANLLSISALNRKDLSVRFHKNGVDIRKNNLIMTTEVVKKKCMCCNHRMLR